VKEGTTDGEERVCTRQQCLAAIGESEDRSGGEEPVSTEMFKKQKLKNRIAQPAHSDCKHVARIDPCNPHIRTRTDQHTNAAGEASGLGGTTAKGMVANRHLKVGSHRVDDSVVNSNPSHVNDANDYCDESQNHHHCPLRFAAGGWLSGLNVHQSAAERQTPPNPDQTTE
jgi:hypothetical protein